MGTALFHCKRLAKYKKNFIYLTNLNVPIKLTSSGLCNCSEFGRAPCRNGLG